MVWRRWPQLAAKHSSTHLEYHQHLEGPPAWATRCLSLVSIAMINAMNKSNLGRAGYTSAYSCSAPWGEVKEPGGRNLKRGRGGPSNTTCLGVVQLRELGSPIPIIIKTIPHRLAYRYSPTTIPSPQICLGCVKLTKTTQHIQQNPVYKQNETIHYKPSGVYIQIVSLIYHILIKTYVFSNIYS